ncbi:hypothetical protein FA13DRAFT_1801127 [Coprinellus micaceus]|uniref:Uncharacterized protein n=1 Tax=Coprinellus micaceus TaxID=71717 RepID=A0A4Y7SFI4_COPMI|nr:hypothetical protein FA13DRAFT_1801127 [Coprinellus micaceus]
MWKNSEEEEFEWFCLRNEEEREAKAAAEVEASKVGGRKKARVQVKIRERDDEVYRNEVKWEAGRTKQIRVVRSMGKLSEVQVYQKMFFSDRVKETTDAEIAERDIAPKQQLAYINLRTAEIYADETEEICDIVRAEAEALEREKEDTEGLLEEIVKGKTREYTPHEYALMQAALPEILKAVFEPLADKTGWTFALLAGGPDPTLTNGECRSVSWYWGKTDDGETFGDCDASFRSALTPFGTFCHRLFPEEVRLRRATTIDEEADATVLEKAGRREGFLEYIDGRSVGEKDEDESDASEDEQQASEEPEQPAKTSKQKPTKARRAPKAKGKAAAEGSKASKKGGGAGQKGEASKGGEGDKGEAERNLEEGQGDKGESLGGAGEGENLGENTNDEVQLEKPISEYPFLTIVPGASDQVVADIAQLLREGEEAVERRAEIERAETEDSMQMQGATSRSAGGDMTHGHSPTISGELTLPDPLFVDDDLTREFQFDVPIDDPLEESADGVVDDMVVQERKRKAVVGANDEAIDGEQGRGKRLRKVNQELPDWVLPGRDWLLLGSDDDLWTMCVHNWQSFETTVMNPSGARIGAANCLPVELGKWLSTRKFNTIPEIPIEDIPDYANRWIVWWNRLQPAVRAGPEPGMLPPKLEREHDAAMVGALKKSGEWGLYIVMVSLKMWAGVRERDGRWRSAVKDVNDCFELFLGMSK